MSQFMSMMSGIKRQIGTGIPNDTEDNPRREGKEHLKVIVLRSGKVLSSLGNLTQNKPKENNSDLSKGPLEVVDEPKSEEVVEPTAKLEKETIGESLLLQRYHSQK